uniref:Putative secreted protein n=1 Tax=Ixodes ricinus TaxID=34613 RepID=A0A6B0UFJ5_IXORI
MFRLFFTIAGASFRSLVAFEWEPSDIREGSWRRSSSATPPPGVAAPSFPGEERGATGFHVGVGASAKRDAVAKATRTLGGTQARGTEIVAGTGLGLSAEPDC